MDTNEKKRLALTGDPSERASGIRVRAGRKMTGLGQLEFGKQVGVGKQAISNIERGDSFPSRELMFYLFEENRLDFNFLVYGDYNQLPSDVQDVLFDKLKDAHSELAQEPSSN